MKAPAIVFDSQEAVQAAFDRGELHRDFIAVVRFQGARANGMPELHRLTPVLGVLQDQGFHVALVTDTVCLVLQAKYRQSFICLQKRY